VPVILWNMKTGKEYRRLLHNENRPLLNDVRKICFSPDGKLLATTTCGLLTLWEVETGKKRFATRDVRHDWFDDLLFSPNGKILACVTSLFADVNGTDVAGKPVSKETLVELWDVSQQIKKRPFGLPVPNDWTKLAFSPDCNLLAAACLKDKKVRIFNVANGKLERTFEAHTGSLLCLVYNIEGKFLFTGGFDQKNPSGFKNCWKAWDPSTGQMLFTPKGLSAPINALAVSPDGRKLATASASDGTVRLWTLPKEFGKNGQSK
jgi:WD40 repeat protein